MPKEYEYGCLLAVFLAKKLGNAQSLSGCLDTFFLFSQTLICALLFWRSKAVSVVYLCSVLILKIALPRPKYRGPANVEYFNPLEFERRVMAHNISTKKSRSSTKKKKKKGSVDGDRWLVLFTLDRTWHTRCSDVDILFSRLSVEFGGGHVQFGKVDLGRWTKFSERFNIDTSSTTSAQLPTIILFENGEEIQRLPPLRPTGEVTRVHFDREGVVKVFSLDGKKKKKEH